jgi:hypothetical protein
MKKTKVATKMKEKKMIRKKFIIQTKEKEKT